MVPKMICGKLVGVIIREKPFRVVCEKLFRAVICGKLFGMGEQFTNKSVIDQAQMSWSRKKRDQLLAQTDLINILTARNLAIGSIAVTQNGMNTKRRNGECEKEITE
jgi:hypothetical protein